MNIVCDCEIDEDHRGACDKCGAGYSNYKPSNSVSQAKKPDLSDGLTAEKISALIRSGFRF